MKIIAILIPVILIILSQREKKSKAVMVIISIYIWLLYSFNTYNGDFESYYLIYNGIQKGNNLWHFEPAFSILMWICGALGLDYFGFKAILGLLHVTILVKIFTKYSKAPTLAMAYFMVFPLLYNISVVRGGFSGLIVCSAFCKYSQDDHTYAKVKYLAWILLATLFHYSASVFIIYILVKKIQTPRKIFIVSVVLSILISLLVYSGLAYNILSVFTDRDKSLQWLSTALYAHLNITGMAMVVIVFVMNYLISCYCYHTIENYVIFEDEEKYLRLAGMTRAANCIVFVALPFAIMSDVMLRFIFEFMAVNIAVYTTAVYIRTEEKSLRWIPPLKNIITFLWVFCLLIYSTLPYLGTEISAFNTLYNNLIFGQKISF